MKFIGFLCLVLFFCFTVKISAQDSAWTYQQCLDYALEHNLLVQRGELNVEMGEVNLKQAKADVYPSVNLGGGYGINWGRSIDPTTNLFRTERIQSLGVQGGASLTLFGGMQKLNTIKQNKLELEASLSDLENAQNDVILNVMTFYTNVIFNQELLETAQLQLETTAQQLSRTEKLVEAGSLAISEVLDLQSQLASNELEVINAENDLNLALLNLKQVMQMPATEELAVVVPEMDAEDYAFDLLSVTDIYQTAEQTMPDVKSADLVVQSTMLGEKIARGRLYPSLSVGYNMFTNYSDANDPRTEIDGTFGTPGEIVDAGYLSSDPSQTITLYTPNPNTIEIDNGVWDQFSDNVSRALNLTVSVPIFNGLATRSDMQRATINREQAEITALEIRNRLRQIIETAYNDAVAASKAYEASQRQVTALEESFRVTERRYNLGVVNFVDYQVAQNNLFRARSDLLRTKYDYIFKTKILDFYQGEPIDF